MGTMVNVLRSEIICVVRRRGMRWGSIRDIVRSGVGEPWTRLMAWVLSVGLGT